MKKRRSKDYGWPHMFYCIADGTYLICKNVAEIPDGFADTRAECDVEAVGEPDKYTGEVPATDEEEAVADAAEDGGDDAVKVDEENPTVTLKDMNVSRKEAIALLTEENVDFKKNATNAELAVMVQMLLHEDEG